MAHLDGHPVVRRLEDSPYGLISRGSALAGGLLPDDVKRLVRSGRWVRLRAGWYVPATVWDQLDDRDGRPLLEIRAAHRSLRNEHVISHTSSARVQGMLFLRPFVDHVHVTKFWTPRARVRAGIKHHQARYRRADVELVDGLPVLGRARTAIDIAREFGFEAGVAAIDAARRAGVAETELASELRPMTHWPGVVVAREAVAFADARAESVGESLLRVLVSELDLGPIEPQFELRDSTGSARCDLRVGRHLFEFDGAVKYRPRALGGLADDPEAVLLAEKARQDWVCGFQLGMSRITWRELFSPARELTKRRLRREYAATMARCGVEIDDLAPYVVRRAG